MDNICTDILVSIGNFLLVQEVLNMEVACGERFMCRKHLREKYRREPKSKEVYLHKKNRIVRYCLHSYFLNDILYTKVKSWYGTHKIITVVTHTKCVSTIGANRWAFRAFTDRSNTRWSQRLFLKLHAN
jgi:hypothetical protein